MDSYLITNDGGVWVVINRETGREVAWGHSPEELQAWKVRRGLC